MDNYERARAVLIEQHKAELLKIADELLAREVLDADQVLRLAKGLPLEEPCPTAPPTPPAGEPPRREPPERPAIVPSLSKPIDAGVARAEVTAAEVRRRGRLRPVDLALASPPSPSSPSHLPDGRVLALGERTLVMGIVNVTPDSFADGGARLDPDRRDRRRRAHGGRRRRHRSTSAANPRGPARRRLDADEEWRRIGPVIEGLRGALRVPISIDTYKAAVAERAHRPRRATSSTTSAR